MKKKQLKAQIRDLKRRVEFDRDIKKVTLQNNLQLREEINRLNVIIGYLEDKRS